MMDTPYYDDLYPFQKAEDECRWIHRWLGLNDREKRVLDLGCGSGRHAVFWAYQYDYEVLGVNMCPRMIELAKARQISGTDFVLGDATIFREEKRATRDLVSALFHVVNFLPGWKSIAKLFETAAYHCKPGGWFFFDTWGPAANLQPKVLMASNKDLELKRVLTPSQYRQDTKISLHYDLFVRHAGDKNWEHSEETILVNPVCEHLIRLLAGKNGFTVVEVHRGFNKHDWFYKLQKE